jgi:amino acid adenylation domain-containing protein
LIEEFLKLYNNEELPALKLQYKDYSQWRNNDGRRKTFRQQEEYWLREFEEEIPVLDIPTDFPRPSVKSFEGKEINFELSNRQTAVLKRIVQDEGTTLFMVVLALYNILLSRLSGQEDIIIGTPVSGRGHADLQRIIGMLVNTLALRNSPRADKTFKEFLGEVKEKALEAFENQNYPFEDLVDALNVQRDTSRNPLFDAMFVLQDSRDMREAQEPAAREDARDAVSDGNSDGSKKGESNGNGEGEPLPGTPTNQAVEFNTPPAKFDLVLTAQEHEKKLLLSFTYCIKLFKEETVKRFGGYFKKIIAAVVGNIEVKPSAIEIIPPEEKEKLLHEFNATTHEVPAGVTMHQLVESRVETTPQRIALVLEDQQLTYLELNKRAGRLSAVLRGKGLKRGSISAIMVSHPLEMIVGIIGILKAGGAYLPIDRQYPRERIDYMLKDSEARYLVTDGDLPGKIVFEKEMIYLSSSYGAGAAGGVAETAAASASPPSPLPVWETAHAASLAYIIYTSGTTGRPKGVAVEHRHVVNTLICRKNLYKMGSGGKNKDTSLQLFSYCFDGFITSLFTPLISGAPVVLVNEGEVKNIDKIIRAIVKNKVTHFISVPALYQVIIGRLTEQETSGLRVITLAGDKVPPGILKLSREKNKALEIAIEYGVTEVSVMSTIYRHQEKDAVIKIGHPTWNTRIYILDKHGKIQPVGIAGEICISGIGVALGYLNQPELTHEKFVNHLFRENQRLYRSGDLGRWLGDGSLEFLGRIDHQVKLRGFRIELGEIENQLLKDKRIKEAVVTISDADTRGGRWRRILSR